MSDEEQESTEEQAPPDGGVSDSKPEGWDQVEMDPRVQKRFNRVYGQLKQGQATQSQLTVDNKALVDRIATLEGSVLKGEALKRAAELKAAKKDALENADYGRVVEIDESLAGLREVKTEAPIKEGPAPENPWLSPERQQAIKGWQAETGEDGAALRPWAQDPGHPHHAKAVRTMTNVMGDPEFTGADIGDILEETDRLMGFTKTTRKVPSVLPSSQTRAPTRGKVTLTQEEQQVANKMGYTAEKYASAIKKWRVSA